MLLSYESFHCKSNFLKTLKRKRRVTRKLIPLHYHQSDVLLEKKNRFVEDSIGE